MKTMIIQNHFFKLRKVSYLGLLIFALFLSFLQSVSAQSTFDLEQEIKQYVKQNTGLEIPNENQLVETLQKKSELETKQSLDREEARRMVRNAHWERLFLKEHRSEIAAAKALRVPAKISGEGAVQNPPLSVLCAPRIVIIVDQSGSLDANSGAITTGLNGFVNNLNNTGTTLTMIGMGLCGTGESVSATITYDGNNTTTHAGFINGLTFIGANQSWSSGLSAAAEVASDLVLLITDGDWRQQGGEALASCQAANTIKNSGSHLFLFGDSNGDYASDIGNPICMGGPNGTTSFMSALMNSIDPIPVAAVAPPSISGIGSSDFIDFEGDFTQLASWLSVINENIETTGIETTSIVPRECVLDDFSMSGEYEICGPQNVNMVELHFCQNGTPIGLVVSAQYDIVNGTWAWEGSVQSLVDQGLNYGECYDVKPVLVLTDFTTITGDEFQAGVDNDFCIGEQYEPVIDELPEEVCFGDPLLISDNNSSYDEYQFEICAVGLDGECLPNSQYGNFVSSGWIDGPIGDLDLERAYNDWSKPEHNWVLWCYNNNTDERFIRYRILVSLRKEEACNEIVTQEEFVTVFCAPEAPKASIKVPKKVCFGEPVPLTDNSSNYDQYQLEICAVGLDGECLPNWPYGNRVTSDWIDGPIGELDLERAYNEWSMPEHDWILWCYNNNTGEHFIRYKVTLNLRNDEANVCNEIVSTEEFFTVICNPEPDYIFTDENGNIKTEFCVGETILLDGRASFAEEKWFLSIWKYEIGGFAGGLDHLEYCRNVGVTPGGFTPGEVGIIPLNPIWANCNENAFDFEPGFEYRVQLAVANGCSGWVAKEDEVFVVKDCSKSCLKANLSANLQWVQDAPNSILALGSVNCTPCNVVQFNWDFGDGNTLTQVPDCPMSFDEIVSHKYEFCGTYNFCVEMISACPEVCKILLCEEVLIEEECKEREVEGKELLPEGGEGKSKKSAKLTNSPNPFNQETTISYYLNSSQEVSLSIYDLQGTLKGRLVAGELQKSGYHSLNFNTSELQKGAYICVFESADYFETLKLIKVE